MSVLTKDTPVAVPDTGSSRNTKPPYGEIASSTEWQFSPCEWAAPHEWPDEEYPFIATTERNLFHYHSGSMSRRGASGKYVKELYIEVNPVDAAAMGVSEGEKVTARSRRGEVTGSARITDSVPEKWYSSRSTLRGFCQPADCFSVDPPLKPLPLRSAQ